MPITVSYDALPSSYAQLAYLTGQGEKKERNLDRRNQRWAQMRQFSLQEQQIANDMEKFYEQLALQRDLLSSEQDFTREQDKTRFGREMALQELRNQGYLDRYGLRSSSPTSRGYSIRPDVLQSLKDGTVEYTPQQKRELAKLNQAENWWNTSPTVNAEQKVAGLSQIQAKRQAILDSPAGKIPENDRDFSKRMEGKIIPYLDSNGKQVGIFYEGKDGNPEFRPMPKDSPDGPDWSDRVKIWDIAKEFAQTYGAEGTATGFDFKQAQKIYNSILNGEPITSSTKKTPSMTNQLNLILKGIQQGVLDLNSDNFASLYQSLSDQEKTILAMQLKQMGVKL